MQAMQSSDQITLALFPFENLSLNNDLNVFCRSFSTDLVTELSRFRQFQILALPGEFSTGESSSSKTLESLQTDYFIRGTFRYDKNRVRINVQLYNSHTQHLVWGNRLEGELTNLIEIQESLLAQVVGVLQQQINYDLLSRMRKRPKVEFRAYEHWLYGMEELKKGSVENDLKAREHFVKALQIQPDYALACSGMSLTYFNEWSCQLWDQWDVCKTGAYEWAQKAIELDDQNYIAALVLGKVFLFERSYETAEYYLRRSLLPNANDPDAIVQIAACFVYLGYGNEALQLYEQALRLNPFNTSDYLAFGVFIFFEQGEHQKAASLIARAPRARYADAEAYYAANFFYLNDTENMRAHWTNFLSHYRKLISHGKDFTQQEAIEWLLKVNPHRTRTNLEAFLQFISNGTFERYTAPVVQPGEGIVQENRFLKETVGWKLSFGGSEVQLPEVKGFYNIQKLLAHPRQLFHCAELMGGMLESQGEEVFDAKARQQYQKRILDLQSDIQQAEQHSDLSRLEKLQDEYDRLIEHLSQSLGLKGSVRKTGSTVERARSPVTWRIRSAIARIERHHPTLAAHLSNSIKTGTFCAYQPERDISWVTS